jgi:copper(I)-binding protein
MSGYHRRMNAFRFLLGFALAAFAPASIQAGPAEQLDIEGAWIRLAPPGSPVMAGYAGLRNRGAGEVVIDAVESEAFGAIEMHEMRDLGGVMRMRPLTQIRVEPDQRVSLAPGGMHLMLFRPVRELAAGDTAELEFVLRDGTRRRATFLVRAAESP